MKKIKILASVFIVFFLLLLLFLLQPINYTPYTQKPHYKKWKEQIENLEIPVQNFNKVGWAKVNITPEKLTGMAGYGKRKGKPAVGVRDSLYARCFVFENNAKSIYLLNADLLIIPPSVTKRVWQKAAQLGIDNSQIYFTATHTHNSLGGWYNTLVGVLFAGPYKEEVEEELASHFISCMVIAQKNTALCQIKYSEDYAPNNVNNRLLKTEDHDDPYIRSVLFKRANDSAALVTYAAHSTILGPGTMLLSRDYPGIVVDDLEKAGFDMACFASGAVGSMGPLEKGETDEEQLVLQGKEVAQKFFEIDSKSSSWHSLNSLSYGKLNLPMALPSPRISKNWALRPWVFYKLFGDFPAYVSFLQLNDILLIGLPCDFSGELMQELSSYAEKKGKQLIITSFNGAYAGYVTADQHFETENYETYTMSWFGPENGKYFTVIVKDIIDLH